jgi:hypothetical protein
MPTSSFTKYHTYVDEVSKGGHNHQTAVWKCALTNTAPTTASDTVWNTTVAPAPAAANGYTAGGNTITTTSATTTASVFKLVLTDTVFTATAGGIGPFRYAILYNSSASNKVFGYYDYGVGGLTLASGESLTVDFDAAAGAFTIS